VLLPVLLLSLHARAADCVAVPIGEATPAQQFVDALCPIVAAARNAPSAAAGEPAR
jgi:hypothetical protein